MFSTSEQWSVIAREMYEAQASALTQLMHAAFDAGANVIGLNADAIEGQLASATVALDASVNLIELNVDTIQGQLASATAATQQLMHASKTSGKAWIAPVARLLAAAPSVAAPRLAGAGLAAITAPA